MTALITVIVSYLMVSRIQYHGFPHIFVKGEKPLVRFAKILSIIALIIAIVIFNVKLFFPCMIIFVGLGIFKNMYEKFIHQLRKEKEE